MLHRGCTDIPPFTLQVGCCWGCCDSHEQVLHLGSDDFRSHVAVYVLHEPAHMVSGFESSGSVGIQPPMSILYGVNDLFQIALGCVEADEVQQVLKLRFCFGVILSGGHS